MNRVTKLALALGDFWYWGAGPTHRLLQIALDEAGVSVPDDVVGKRNIVESAIQQEAEDETRLVRLVAGPLDILAQDRELDDDRDVEGRDARLSQPGERWRTTAVTSPRKGDSLATRHRPLLPTAPTVTRLPAITSTGSAAWPTTATSRGRGKLEGSDRVNGKDRPAITGRRVHAKDEVPSPDRRRREVSGPSRQPTSGVERGGRSCPDDAREPQQVGHSSK